MYFYFLFLVVVIVILSEKLIILVMIVHIMMNLPYRKKRLAQSSVLHVCKVLCCIPSSKSSQHPFDDLRLSQLRPESRRLCPGGCDAPGAGEEAEAKSTCITPQSTSLCKAEPGVQFTSPRPHVHPSLFPKTSFQGVLRLRQTEPGIVSLLARL